jgi:hypothetical protein
VNQFVIEGALIQLLLDSEPFVQFGSGLGVLSVWQGIDPTQF